MQSLRYTLRTWRKNSSLVAIILLTLSLGVGANTAIFTVVYATLLAPLPFPQSERLVSVWTLDKSHRDNPSPQDFLAWRRYGRAFQSLSAFTGGTFDVATLDQPENVWGMRVSSNYYRTLGVSFFLGRDFLPGEDRAGKNHVVILTHKLWKHLGGNAKLVGHTLRIDGEPYTVAGVLQPGIADRDIFQMSVPLVFTPEELDHDILPLVIGGRLRPSVSMGQAQEDINALIAHAGRISPRGPGIKFASVRPLKDYMASLSGDMKQTLWLLLGGSTRPVDRLCQRGESFACEGYCPAQGDCGSLCSGSYTIGNLHAGV